MRYSTNDFASAAEVFDSVAEQNQLMEVVAVDFADIINQIAEFECDAAMTLPKLRSIKDVQYVVAQAAAKLRVMLAEFHPERLTALQDEIDSVNDTCDELEEEIKELRRTP